MYVVTSLLLAHRSRGGASVNLALGRIPTGSSDSYGASFAGATDGSTERDGWWRASPHDNPSFLVLDLGAPAIISSMNITGGDPSFKMLRTYRSGDGIDWAFVRQEKTPHHCLGGSTTQHTGWKEPTRYIIIQMEDHCSGVHLGHFSLAEWRVYGFYDAGMVQKSSKTWPHCENLGACFEYVDLQAAQATCLADPDCDGFSFSAGSVSQGRGGGCYKTLCKDDGGNGYGYGSHGYWAKQRPSGKWEGGVLDRPSTWPWGDRWPWGNKASQV